MSGSMSEIATAFVSLIPTFKGGASRIVDEVSGPARQAGEAAGADMGSAMRDAVVERTAGIGAAVGEKLTAASGEAESAGAEAGGRFSSGFRARAGSMVESIGEKLEAVAPEGEAAGDATGHRFSAGVKAGVSGLGSGIVQGLREADAPAEADGEEAGSRFAAGFRSRMSSLASSISSGLGAGRGHSEEEGEKEGESFGGRFKERGGEYLKEFAKSFVVPMAGFFAAEKVAETFKESIELAEQQEKVSKRTEQIVDGVGKSAGVSSEQVEEAAHKLGDSIGKPQQQIQTMMNTLLQTGHVGKDQLEGISQTTEDMAAAMHIGDGQAAKMMSRIISDPVKASASLSRFGVTLDDTQKKQIKTYEAAGQSGKAAGVIIDALNKKFHGAAEASTSATDKLKAGWSNVETQIGEKILPILDKVVEWLNAKVVPAVSKFIGEMSSGKGAGGAFAKDLQEIGKILGEIGSVLAKVLPPLMHLVSGVLSKIGPAVPGILAMVAAFKGLQVATGIVKDVANGVSSLKDKAGTALNAFKRLGTGIGSAGSKGASGFKAGISKISSAAQTAASGAKSKFSTIVDAAKTSGSKAATALSDGFKAVGSKIGTGLSAAKTAIADFGTKSLSAAKSVGQFVLQLGKAGVAATVNAAKTIAMKGAEMAVAAATKAWELAQAALDLVMNANPIFLVITAIVALGVGLYEAYKHSKTFRDGVNALWNICKKAFAGIWHAAQEAFNWIKSHWQLLLAILTGPVGLAVYEIKKHWSTIKKDAEEAWNAIKGAISKAWNGAVSAIRGGIRDVEQFLSQAWNAIKNVTHSTWDGIKTFFSTVWSNIKALFTGAVHSVETVLTVAWNAIRNTISAVWGGIKTFFSTVWSNVKAIFSNAVHSVETVLSSAWNTIKSTVSTVWNSIKSILTSAWNSIRSTVRNAISTVEHTMSSAWNSIKNAMSRAWDAIKSTMSRAWDAIKNTVTQKAQGVINFVRQLPSKIKSALGNLGSLLVSAGSDLINGLVKGVENAASGAVKAVGNVVHNLVSTAMSFIPHSPAKQGPLSGSGWTRLSESGVTFAKQWAGGIDKGQQHVVASLGKLTSSAMAQLPTLGATASAGGSPIYGTRGPIPAFAGGTVPQAQISDTSIERLAVRLEKRLPDAMAAGVANGMSTRDKMLARQAAHRQTMGR